MRCLLLAVSDGDLPELLQSHGEQTWVSSRLIIWNPATHRLSGDELSGSNAYGWYSPGPVITEDDVKLLNEPRWHHLAASCITNFPPDDLCPQKLMFSPFVYHSGFPDASGRAGRDAGSIGWIVEVRATAPVAGGRWGGIVLYLSLIHI